MQNLEFEEIQVCPYCGSPAEERFIGDEGATFCTDGCGNLEGERNVYKFICPKCEELKDEEKCDCETKLNHK